MKIKIDLYLIFSLMILLLFKQAEQFIIFYIFVVLHELAHIIMACILNIKIIDVSFLPFGVNAKFEFGDNKIKEIIVACFGPIFSIILGIFYEEYYIQNLFIFAVNIIPVYPLDGGRIFKNFLVLLLGQIRGSNCYNVLLKIFIIILLIINISIIIFLKVYNFIFVTLYIIQLAEEELKRDKVINQITSMLNVEN